MKYTDFCNTIDSVFTVKGLDKDPTKVVKQSGVEEALPARRKRMEMDDESKKKLFEALNIASKLVLTQRFNMKPFFQAFDTTACGFISKTQFARVLSQVGLKPTEDTMNVILKCYMNKGNVDEVNYVDFVNDVDKPEVIYQIEEKDVSLLTATQMIKKNEEKKNKVKSIVNRKPEDLDDVLGFIRKKVKEERIRLDEFLRDFDKLRSGSITATQLRLGLNMAKLVLSNAEFDVICENFASTIPGKVLWRDFVTKIEEVFTLKGLEKVPTLAVEEAKTEMKYGKLTPSEEQAAICAKIIDKFS
jgi:Ca2+-binding EF-hand superfamily protein